MDNIPRAYTGPCATRPDTTNDAAVALLLNPYDNCSREVNRDLRVYFSKYENEPLENGKHSWGSAARQGSIHALWYSKFPGETLHYGVARYEGRDYAYEFHTKDSQYDLGLMDTGRYVCSGTINVAK
jgi:hypothetical protein